MELIDKDALVAEIKRRIDEINQLGKNASYEVGLVDAYKIMLSFLDTLEVEEVDLEEELRNYIKHYRDRETGYSMFGIAKHFFELGLKAQKGE